MHELSLVMISASPLEPDAGNKRCADIEWSEHPLYKRLLQAYLAWSAALGEYVDKLDLGRISKDRAPGPACSAWLQPRLAMSTIDQDLWLQEFMSSSLI